MARSCKVLNDYRVLSGKLGADVGTERLLIFNPVHERRPFGRSLIPETEQSARGDFPSTAVVGKATPAEMEIAGERRPRSDSLRSDPLRSALLAGCVSHVRS